MFARALLMAAAVLAPSAAEAQVFREPMRQRSDAIVDLRTAAGAALVGATWRTQEAVLVEVKARGPGPDLRASGPEVIARDVRPRAEAADFDDSQWRTLPADQLDARLGNGKVAFQWYRTTVTLPAKVAELETRGTTVVFELVVDDYAEIWVDGELVRRLGDAGGAVVSGFNAPNRVVLTRDARPGQRFSLAVFAMNGPISAAPDNFIWVRSASLDFYKSENVGTASFVPTEIRRLDRALDDIVPRSARIERVADGFSFTEGPVWDANANELVFSDPNENTIYRLGGDGRLTVFRTKSGYSGADIARYHQPGSNGLAFDREGRLTVAEHGNRRITRIEKNGTVTVLADREEGRRLNSPNDLVYRSDGVLYFTDPPFGLPKVYDDPGKELPYSGVYALANGKLLRVANELIGPNGLAFSPDEKTLYVSNWDPKKKLIMAYDVEPSGALSGGRVFFDLTRARGEEALDGLKVNRAGHVFVSGPGGVHVISPSGKHLGVIKGPELPANFAFGGEDGRTLYMTARTGVYRLRMSIPGATSGMTVAKK